MTPGTFVLSNSHLTATFAADERILDFDGAELGDGLELPCWRVLFAQGHREGLLLVARSKAQMSHIQTYRRGLEVRPHVMCSYSSDNALVDTPLPLDRTYTGREKREEARHARIDQRNV